MTGLKIAVIGGGSSYTPELVRGLMELHSRHPLRELALLDVAQGKTRQDIVQGLARRMLLFRDIEIPVISTTDADLALAGADFVVLQFRVGGMVARAKDEHIALQHGVVGQETTGPGGFAKAIRTIPVALEYAKLVQKLCPEAWIINFTNPSGIITETLHSQGFSKVIGLCNVPLTMQHSIAKGLNQPPDQVRLLFAGLNHLSFVTGICLDGEEYLPRVLTHPATEQWLLTALPGLEHAVPWVSTLGVVPSPYLLYYFFHGQMLAAQRTDVSNGKGTRADQVMRIESELFASYQNNRLVDPPAMLSQRGGAWYSQAAVMLMQALRSEQPLELVLNLPNDGTQPWMPESAVIETNCLVNRHGPRALAVPAPPASLQGLVQHVKAFEQATIKAALSGQVSDMVLALCTHPLVGDWRLANALVHDYLTGHKDYIRVRRV